MTDVARAAGVSRMTVSYTYSQPGRVSAETAARVQNAAAELGYPGPHPGARSLRRGHAGALGVVLAEHLSYAFDDPQAARFLAGVADVCAAAAVAMTLVPVTGGESDTRRISEAAVDGFVVWTTTDDDPALDAVAATGLPAVLHAGPARPGVAAVGMDDRAAARAVGELVRPGTQRAAVLSLPLDRDRQRSVLQGPDPDTVRFPVTRHRLQGLQDAWRDGGADWAQVLVTVCARNQLTEGRSRTAELLERPDPPDTIVALSDELALGALQACTTAGFAVPGDVAVTGWDDSDAAQHADLTTVHQSLREQGALCAQLALDPDTPAPTAGWRLIVRRSTRSSPDRRTAAPRSRT